MHRQVLTAAAAVLAWAAAGFGQMAVVAVSPSPNESNVARTAGLSVSFDRPVDQATFTPANFKAFGRLSGPIGPGLGLPAALSFSPDGRTAFLTPSRPLVAGETVLIMMSRNLRGADGVALRSAGYTSSFVVAARRSAGAFREIGRVSNRDLSGAQTRIYGGLACDLNRDGWCDLTTVNEVSADLRVFLNRADGSGGFLPMLTPYTPIPVESSPNEVGDFNGDGLIDAVISSNAENRIAVCLGQGNGRFSSPSLISTAGYPRGLGVFDADGDGDFDIVVSCATGNTVQVYRNNGGVAFGAPTNIESGGQGEYGLATADMNGDGIMDLVVGCEASETVHVMRGNGNATFTTISSRALGGRNWVVACGDIDGDGDIDVSAANSGSANGSILKNSGNGTLQSAVVRPTGGHTVSTDLADLDGDGDLDWVLSSFGAGLWYVYRNDGTGAFAPLEEVVAPANPSCAVPMDIDNDGDIDLVLTDEIADVIITLENFCAADFNQDSTTDPDDLSDYIACYFSSPACAQADFNADGQSNPDDLSDYIAAFFGGC